MYAIWTLCLSNLRRKKLQNGLIALLILLSTLMLATSVTIISSSENVFTDMHNKANGSHQLLTFSNGQHDPRMVHEWWSEQEGVNVSELMPFRYLYGFDHEGQSVPNLYLMMMDTPEYALTVDKLIFAQGQPSLAPEKGSIWIPTSMAYSHDIALGDTLEFYAGEKKLAMQVSGIVVDIPYGAPFTTTARIWMNNEDYNEQIAALEGKELFMMGIRYDDYSERLNYWERFEQYLGEPYQESKTEFEEISSFYLIINKIIGFIMIFVGVVMIFIALFTISFTIADAVLTNYRTIGVLQSIGMTASRTMAVYVLQYALLAVISIVPGLLLSSLLSRVIVDTALSYLKTPSTPLQLQGFASAVAVGLLVFLIVLACVWLYARRVRSVHPVQAIRYGMSEQDSSRLARRLNRSGSNRLGFGSLPVLLVIGLRAVLINRKGSILMMALAAVTSAILVLGFVLLNSIASSQQTAAAWGYDSANVAVVVLNEATFPREELVKELLADKRIKNIGWLGAVNGVLPSQPAISDKEPAVQPMNINVTVVDGSYEELGYGTLEGDNPRNLNEIALGVNVARTWHKQLGDVIEVYIQGNKHTFTVTGIYQAIANMSYSARITVDAVQAYNPDYVALESGFINLIDPKQADLIVSELKARYKLSMSAVTQKTLLDSVFKEAVTVLLIPMSLMGLLFVIVTFIIIYSVARINIRKESRTYGIYKSIGMTSAAIRWSITLGIIVISAIGAVLGMAAGVYLLPKLMNSILANYGIVELPLVMNYAGVAGVAALSICSAALGSWVSSKAIHEASPRKLVVE